MKRKNVDVLFLYETKVRELENICLIKSELEKRGMSVAVMNTWNNIGIKKPPFKAKVVVTHGMYHDGIYLFVKDFCGDVPKIVNMQWEQIGYISDESNPQSRYVLKGIAKQCMHICWGDKTYRRLRDLSKIDDKHLALTGQVSFDFCKKEFRNYYLSKDQLLKKYSIDASKTINLFISSFSYVNLPDRLIEVKDEKSRKFIDFSVRSFNDIIKWFDRFLSEHDDEVLIYRPHPAEANNDQLGDLEKKYSGRFKVISEMSVKQWISIADRAYSWYSTSVAEAYMFNVPVSILRPVDIPDDIEISLYKNARFITSYTEFLKTVNTEASTSIDETVFNDLYYVDNGYAYIRVADTIEKVYRDNGYLIINPPTIQSPGFKQKAKQKIYDLISYTTRFLPKMRSLDKYRKSVTPDAYTVERQKSNYASEEEIAAIQKNIERVLIKNV